MQPEYMTFKKMFDIGSKNVETNVLLKVLVKQIFFPKNMKI